MAKAFLKVLAKFRYFRTTIFINIILICFSWIKMVSDVAGVGKYGCLAILASLLEPKSLSELGLFWYNENGRFYKKKARQEIRLAVEKDYLLRLGSKYKANTKKILSYLCSDIKNDNYKSLLFKFWEHPFSQQTYFCCKTIRSMFQNPEKFAETDMGLIVNMPLILSMIQEKDSEFYNLFVLSHGLEKYTNIINIESEKNMPKLFRNLKEKTDWVSVLNKIIKSNGYLLRHTGGELKIKHMLKKKTKVIANKMSRK